MLRLILLMFPLYFLAANPAFAFDQKSQKLINSVFSDLERHSYSQEAVQEAQMRLHKARHPSTLTASILLAQYETQSPTLVKGLLTQLGHDAKTHLKATTGSTPIDVNAVIDIYDGSTPSLVESLFWLRGQEKNKTIDWGRNGPHFEIPCIYFKRHPDIGQFTKFTGRHWHRFSRPILDISCHKENHLTAQYPNISALWKLGRDIAYESPSCGSIYKDHAAGRKFSRYELFYRPLEFRRKPVGFNEKPRSLENLRHTSLFDWALIGRQNYETYLELETLYDTAKIELTDYFNQHFDDPDGTFSQLIPYMLLSQIHGGARLSSFSRAMDKSLTGQRDIRTTILSGEVPSNEDLISYKETPIYDREKSIISHAGFPEPLLHIATKNLSTLEKMLALNYDIESKGALGKTALMVATQDDNYLATLMLIEAGADVNSINAHPDNIPNNGKGRSPCNAYNVTIGERTALNYALAEGSEDLINLLLENGAKTNVIDSSGNSVIDYLEGTGPTEKNPKLSPEFRKVILGKLTHDSQK